MRLIYSETYAKWYPDENSKLCHLAMVLVACGDSDSGDSGGVNAPPPKTIVSAELVNFPYHADEPDAWGAFEGTPVNLRGTEVRVTFQDGTRDIIRDVSRFQINPPIYMLNSASVHAFHLRDEEGAIGGTGRANGVDVYTLTFVWGNFVQQWDIYNGAYPAPPAFSGTSGAIGNVQPLVNAAVVGTLSKLDYYVDDERDLSGISIMGYYGDTHPSQVDLHGVNLTPYMNLYQWRWVWNTVRAPSGEDGFQGQNPGLLLRIGTWGDFRGELGVPEPLQPTDLTGLRIPVRNLWQVEEITWTTRPAFREIGLNPNFPAGIFFDDPRFVGRSDEGWRISNWEQNLIRDGVVSVRYSAGAPEEKEFRVNAIQGSSFIKHHWSMDVDWRNDRRDGGTAGSRSIANENAASGLWVNPYLVFYKTDELIDTPAGRVRYGEGVSDGDLNADWITWLEDENQQLSVVYRGIRSPTLEVPVFNELVGITVRNISGQTPLLMDGTRRVDRRPDAEAEFLRKIEVSAEYRSTRLNTTRGRDNVITDLARRQMRGGVPGDPATTASNAGLTTNVNNSAGIADPGIFNATNSASFAEDSSNTEEITVTVFARLPTNAAEGDAEEEVPVGQRNY